MSLKVSPIQDRWERPNTMTQKSGSKGLMLHSESFRLVSSLAVGKSFVLLGAFVGVRSSDFIHAISTRWDGQLFETIATQGYTQPMLYAFSPFFPGIVRVLSYSPQSAWVSALLVSNVLSFIVPLIIRKIFGFRTALLSELFPTYLVYTTVPYSDVLTVFFVAGALLFLSRGFLFRASFSVSMAILNMYNIAWTLLSFLPAVVRGWRWRGVSFYILPLAVGALLLLWYYAATGSLLTFFVQEREVWGVGFADPVSQAEWLLNTNGLGWFTSQPWTFFSFVLPPAYWFARNLLFESFYLAGCFYLLKSGRADRRFLFLYTLSVCLPLLFIVGTPAISIPRLLLPAFPVFYSYSKLLKKSHDSWYSLACFVLAALISIEHVTSFFS